jgi:hypothetical protein
MREKANAKYIKIMLFYCTYFIASVPGDLILMIIWAEGLKIVGSIFVDFALSFSSMRVEHTMQHFRILGAY